MDFRPINADHAVQSATFSIVLDSPVSASQLQTLRGRNDILAELPAVQAPDVIEFQVAPGQIRPSPQRVAGIQLSHLRPDGIPAWALKLVGVELVVECNRYTRWDRVWETVRKYLQAGFEAVGDRKIVAVGCMVIDAFPANRERYDLHALLRPGPMLASRVFTSGPTWHNHLGWFDPTPSFAPPCYWLNQLNIDAMRLAPDNLRVQIAHNQELRFDPDATAMPEVSALDKWFSELHLNNKRVLIELLEQSVSRQIGLGLK